MNAPVGTHDTVEAVELTNRPHVVRIAVAVARRSLTPVGNRDTFVDAEGVTIRVDKMCKCSRRCVRRS